MRRTALLLVLSIPIAADQLTYQKPPKEILEILNDPQLPALAVNPARTYATLSQSMRYPPIADVSAPMLRLAGIRIDPHTNGLHLAPYNTSITLVKLPEGTQDPDRAATRGARWRITLVARWKAVRAHQHDRCGHYRAVARRSRVRQDS